MVVKEQVLGPVVPEWETAEEEELEFVFVKDGPTTHEDYLRFLEYLKETENDEQRKNH